MLLAAGADPNQMDSKGTTPLNTALISVGSTDMGILRILIEGKTCLAYLSVSESNDVLIDCICQRVFVFFVCFFMMYCVYHCCHVQVVKCFQLWP